MGILRIVIKWNFIANRKQMGANGSQSELTIENRLGKRKFNFPIISMLNNLYAALLMNY